MDINKPEWLKTLEQESWQAELIVSGIAIFGSLQLPGLLNVLTDKCLVFFSEELYFGLYGFFIYLYFAVDIIIVCLIIHFIIRTLWIGWIGLNSVFPHGINVNDENYPKHFMERLVSDYPNDLKQITDLDDFCSLIFGFCAFMVLTFVAITLNIGVLLLAYKSLMNYVSINILNGIFSFYLLAISFGGLLVYLFNIKQFKDKAITKKIQYPIYKVLTIFAFHIFRKPIIRLSFTFFSNLDLKKYLSYIGGLMVILIALIINQAMNGHFIYFTNKDLFYNIYDRPHRIHNDCYENLRSQDSGRLLSAILESDRIADGTMKVFVPVFSNEDDNLEELCGTYDPPEGMDKMEKSAARRKFKLDCQKRYHEFYLDDKLVQPEIIQGKHKNKGESGIFAYINTTGLAEGMHILKIEKRLSESQVYRTMQLPFYFEKP